MDRVLVIVHLEPDFEHTAGNLEPLVKKVVKYSRSFDSVLNIVSAPGLTGTPGYPELQQFRSKEWIWGFDADYYKDEEPDKWIEGKNYLKTNGHEWSEILDWMNDLPKNDNYTLVGGARSECLQDVLDIFQHLQLKVKVKETLTY